MKVLFWIPVIPTTVTGRAKAHTLIRKANFRHSGGAIFAAVASHWSKIHFAIRPNMLHLSSCQIGHCSWLPLTGLYGYIKKTRGKKLRKETTSSLTTQPLQQEHVRDRTVKCAPAVHKQLHSTTPPRNLPVFVAPDKRALNECARVHERLEREKCLQGKYCAWPFRACVQNNYMLHCCDKNEPRQQLFAANLAWEVPGSGGINLIGYCMSAAPVDCRLLAVKGTGSSSVTL